MNTDDVRRRLEALGAAMEWIVLVPADTKVDGWRREDKQNLVETSDGYITGFYERGRLGGGGTFFSDLDAACQRIAKNSRRMAEDHRKSKAREARWRREAAEREQVKE